MADYYPLSARAVAALEKNNGENRRALYERARAALLAQLRGVTPALEESDITRERLALEESIRKVEAEAARQFVEASRQMSAAKIRQSRQWDEPSKVRPTEARPAEPRRWAEVEPPASAPRRYGSPPSPAPQESAPASPQETARRAWLPGTAPSRSLPEPQHSDSIFDRPLPPAPAAREAGTEQRSLFDTALRAVRGVPSEEVSGTAARAEESEREDDAVVPAGGRRFLRPGGMGPPQPGPRGAGGPRKGDCGARGRGGGDCGSGGSRIRTRVSPSRCWSRRTRSTTPTRRIRAGTLQPMRSTTSTRMKRRTRMWRRRAGATAT